MSSIPPWKVFIAMSEDELEFTPLMVGEREISTLPTPPALLLPLSEDSHNVVAAGVRKASRKAAREEGRICSLGPWGAWCISKSGA